ncbi:hypothetical protein [Halostagnicola sp. A-GB9-2]|uniref:hypothetical protein n=1 Tax=Halostagnicola sp. A-GB9-2 TaxID=3048066 RepID=UPI0024C094CA|nr:hypothetical protein [Halostagnicola sp. A-GB9-2]MDJ1432713.1 hypothetical protein [Halostagnicola sp. A-GB9-2]
MDRRPPRDPSEDALVCADVLGAFGISTGDIERRTTGDGDRRSTDESALEETLTDALEDARDRTAFLRRTICGADRGIDCSARYSSRDLEGELGGVFASLGWSVDLFADRSGLELSVSGSQDRTRELAVDYPETPLGSDNLPAVLSSLNERLLSGVGARFVLLSAGVDRWRAALIESDELEGLRDRYGDRIEAFERPLRPEHDCEFYGSDDPSEPWPEWASERTRKQTGRRAGGEPNSRSGDGSSFITEAEPSRSADSDRSEHFDQSAPSPNGSGDPDVSSPSSDSQDKARTEPSRDERTASREDPSDSNGEYAGFELAGGSPTVTRSGGSVSSESVASDPDPDSGGVSDRDDRNSDGRQPETSSTSAAKPISARSCRDLETGSDDGSESGFGTLSGSPTTTRVSSDSFDTADETQTDEERYRALGAALGTGEDVSVTGLLEDDEFLPELPAVEPNETRLTFDDPFEPGAIEAARARSEQSGFEWVDSGSLETTRISNG